MKKAVCFLLSLSVLLVLLAGCKETRANELVGKWQAKVNVVDYVTELLKSDSISDELEKYFEFDDFSITLIYTFKEDGTYFAEVDKEALSKEVDDFYAECKDNLIDLNQTIVDALDQQDDLDEYLKQNDMTLEEAIKKVYDNMQIADNITVKLKGDGNYIAKDGRLYMSDGIENAIDEAVYDIYELSDGELRLTEHKGEVNRPIKNAYPIVFKKISD